MAQVSLTGRTVTLDGIEVSVMANVRSREDMALAMERGADGIGLFRTEPFFLSAKHFPSDSVVQPIFFSINTLSGSSV